MALIGNVGASEIKFYVQAQSALTHRAEALIQEGDAVICSVLQHLDVQVPSHCNILYCCSIFLDVHFLHLRSGLKLNERSSLQKILNAGFNLKHINLKQLKES